ncbi:MAG: hypothetical protein ABI454_06770, partial [Sphingomicrobium sp.]
MAVEQDPLGWLPEPPPPRPARRDATIEAALRRFDGLPDATPAASERPRGSWASTHRPQLAVAISAMLLVIVGIPAALIGLRNAPPPSERAPSDVVAHQGFAPAPAPAQRTPGPVEVAEAPPSSPQIGAAPPLRQNRGEEPQLLANNEPAAPAQAARAPATPAPAPPAPELAEAAPPPPPPPPPQLSAPSSETAVADAQKAAVDAAAQSNVVTGSRIRQPPTAYAAFVPRLQAAVRTNDRRALIRLIAFPLRVNGPGGPKFYRDGRSVKRDFERIFTPRVRRAILDQASNGLFVRDQGAMVGSGEVWIAQTCPNRACSPAGA